MRQTRVTPLLYQTATDASGGVARQKKIVHTYESPFYQFTQFPHPFAIIYGWKKYSRYFLDKPCMPDFKLCVCFVFSAEWNTFSGLINEW
jgi:hypothetical protein